MNKQEKFLLLVVLLVSGLGATIYVSNQKEGQGQVVEQVQNINSTQNNTSDPQDANLEVGQNSQQQTSSNSGTETVSRVTKSVGYKTPQNHTENLVVNVTLKNGIIEDVTFSMNPTNKESGEYYQNFSSAFPKSEVVGKSVSDVNLSRVGGASLTTNAFNSAIKGI